MDVRLLWAGVWFTAQNGDAENLLSEAARAGLHLSAVSPAPGGFSGRCAAWQYRNLAALARKRRVRLRIQTRTGLYFRLRPFLRRRGLWVGVLLFVPLLVWSQDLVWAVDAGSLTTGQRAGRGDPAGAGAADARKRCHAGKTDRRRIRSFAEQRVFLGEPELSGRAARSGSSCRKAGARHRRREGRRRLCQSGRNGGPHQSCKRDDACRARTDRGGRAITHWDLPHRAGRNADL